MITAVYRVTGIAKITAIFNSVSYKPFVLPLTIDKNAIYAITPVSAVANQAPTTPLSPVDVQDTYIYYLHISPVRVQALKHHLDLLQIFLPDTEVPKLHQYCI
jgi:hypothetical protein